MTFAFVCIDDGDQGESRKLFLIDHLKYIEKVIDKVVLAGPCPSNDPEDGRQFQGSIMIYEGSTEEEARKLFEGDPYVKNGIWKEIFCLPFDPVAGQLIGGQTWLLDGDSIITINKG